METVYVNRNGVKVLINKSDFDEKIEKLWQEPETKAKKAKTEGGE